MTVLHFFIPHAGNNHKPKAIHNSYLAVYIAAFFFFNLSLGLLFKYKPEILGIATDISAQKLWQLTNKERQKSGLTELKISDKLTQSALAKANDMFARDYWAHNSPDGKTPWDFISAAGYKYLFAGENLARDFGNSEAVVSAWMASPTHRANILKSQYQDIGFAVVNGTLNGQETTLVVQEFGVESSPFYLARTPQKAEKTAFLPETKPVAGAVNLSSVLSPHYSKFLISKTAALGLSGFLFLMFALDGVFLYIRRLDRRSGHNLAHLIFTGSFLSALYFATIGMII